MGSTPVDSTRDLKKIYELKGGWEGWRDDLVVKPLAEDEFGFQHHTADFTNPAPDHTPGLCGQLHSYTHVYTYVHTCLTIVKINVKNK